MLWYAELDTEIVCCCTIQAVIVCHLKVAAVVVFKKVKWVIIQKICCHP